VTALRVVAQHILFPQDSIVDVNRPLFDAQPSEIIFQQFEPPASYEISLSLRNIDKVSQYLHCNCCLNVLFSYLQVARSVKLLHEESPYFTIIPPKPGGNKVAPGMVAAYTIKFTPDEKKVRAILLYKHHILMVYRITTISWCALQSGKSSLFQLELLVQELY